jgi:hypothetical protein
MVAALFIFLLFFIRKVDYMSHHGSPKKVTLKISSLKSDVYPATISKALWNGSDISVDFSAGLAVEEMTF